MLKSFHNVLSPVRIARFRRRISLPLLLTGMLKQNSRRPLSVLILSAFPLSGRVLSGRVLLGHILSGMVLLDIVLSGPVCLAQVPAGPVQHVELAMREPDTASPASPQSLGDVLRLCLLNSLQEEYVDLKHWKGSVERFDGFRVRGLHISRRKREVEHGFWRRYKARLIRPEETLQLTVTQIPGEADSVRFRIELDLQAQCEATFVWWTYGVKGWNGTGVSQARLRAILILDTRPQVRFSFSDPLPRLDLRPQIQDLKLKLIDLDLERLGIFDGPVVTALGDGSREAIEQLIQTQEKRLRQQLQAQLDRQTGTAP